MSLPEHLSAGGFKSTRYGVALSLEGGDDAYPIEVQRSSDLQPTAASSGSAFFAVGNSLISSGATAAAAATSNPQGSSWIAHYSASVVIAAACSGDVGISGTASFTVTVARETLSSVGGTWQERGSTTYTCATTSPSGISCPSAHEDLGLVLPSTGTIASSTTDNVRLLIKETTSTLTGDYTTGDLSFSVHGFSSSGDPHAGVTWTTPATTGGPSSSGWTTIGLLKAGETIFREILPHTTARHWYRSRHFRADVEPGAFTTSICAQTGRLLETLDESSPWLFTARALLNTFSTAGGVLYGDVAVESTGTIFVRTSTGGSTSLSKTIRIPFAEFVPENDTTVFIFDAVAGRLQPGNLAQQGFVAPTVFPKGVTLSAMRARRFRATTGDVMNITLWQLVTDDAPNNLLSLGAGTTGWTTLSGALNQLVGDQSYNIQLSMDVRSTGIVSDLRFAWAEFDYGMPSYDKGY